MMELAEEVLAAQRQLAAVELEERFQRNMALFQAVMPEAYHRFAHHRPERIGLVLDGEGEPLLVNSLLGDTPVYAQPPRPFCRAQVARFRREPKHFRCHNRTTSVVDEENNAHIANSNRLVRLLLEHPRDEVDGLPPVVDFLLVLGLGLGYPVEELLKEHDLRHMCIVEPEADIFYASLHTLEWGPILEHFAGPGRSLELIVAEEPAACEAQLEAYLTWIGGYHVFRPFIFEHLVSEKLAAAFRGFFDRLMPKLTGQLGYFDDERVGLAHTVANHAAGVPFMKGHASDIGTVLDKPAFVVANGPSLDAALDFLREHRDQAVLFSCGTALGSLRKAGLKPDFHVEMERSRPVLEWLSASTDAEYREDITLLALNTVHPQVMSLFPSHGMAMKPNDLGVEYLKGYMEPGARVASLPWCNPTVANAALSFATALGFRDVTLFGLDLGFPAGEQHHSRLSAHYDVKENQRHTLGLYRHDDGHNITAPGNFGGEVVSTPTYRNARVAVEQILTSTPGVRCANASRGVRIQGAHPLDVTEADVTTERFDTRAYAQALFRRYFTRKGIAPARVEEARVVFDATGPALAELEQRARGAVSSRAEGMALLARVHGVVVDLEEAGSRHVAALLRGSVTMFCFLLAQALHQVRDEDACVDLFQHGRAHFLAFLAHAGHIAAGDVLAPDERTRNLAAKWEKAV